MTIQKTSCSDNYAYPMVCAEAAKKDEVFRKFRRHPDYTQVVETVSRTAGKDYLDMALCQTPHLLNYMTKFASSDQIGDPVVYRYRYKLWYSQRFAPTTLRYIKVLSDLILQFGSLDKMNIVEIGGGYGGLCKIIADIFHFNSYLLVDLAPCLTLAQKFLNQFSVPNVSFQTSEDIAVRPVQCDLVISNYAFSEVARHIQDIYVDNIILPSKRGYMLCNFASHTWEAAQYSQTELQSKKQTIETFNDNQLLSPLDLKYNISLLVWRS